MPQFDIEFRPNPMQKSFIESRAKADLFSSRMGEGKSTGLVWSTFFHTKHNPGANWAIIRDTWENLKATTLKSFFEWFPPGVAGTWKATDKEFTWNLDGMGKGTVVFLGMDDPADASKLMSRELAGFAIDEPAPATGSGGVDEMIFTMGLSRLRQKGMKWYGVKLAENNPDETHWTYREFVDPGNPEFRIWQPNLAENIKNLPPAYYEGLRRTWAKRPDLVRRFVDGQFGFQQIGKSVTPEWSDGIHLGLGMVPLPNIPLQLLWDFGLNPTCAISQVTPLGLWNVLEAHVGEEIGVTELIREVVRPTLAQHYRGFTLRHIGDPAGEIREQSSSMVSAVSVIRKELGGPWFPGPRTFEPRREALRGVLSQQRSGRGLLQVDRYKAKPVWLALRGGWHFNQSRGGVVSTQAVKDIHSHPGDAVSYGASVLFPPGKIVQGGHITTPKQATFGAQGGLGFERPGLKLPKEARTLGGGGTK